MAYTYEQVFAADPANPSNIAQNASITIFAPGDGTMTPIAITDPDGQPLANPIPVNANGFGSAFMADIDRVAWLGGGFTGFFTSYEGMKEVAVAAQEAAETAASTAGVDAAAVATAAIGDATADATAAAASAASSATAAASSAALVGAPADTAIAAAINGTGATKTALSATIDLAAKASTLRPAAAARPAKPLVVFTFDDNPRTDWTAIKPILDAKAVKATFCAVTSSVSTGTFLTWAELRQLQSEGHEINNHSATHVGVSGASAALLKAEISDPYDTFVANGIRPTGYTYPGGTHDAAARAEVRKNHAYALTVGNAANVQPLKSYAIDRKGLDNATTLATHQAEVDAALAGNHVLVYLIHSGGMDAAALTKLGALIDYIKAKPVAIVTMAQAISEYGNLVDTGDQTGGKYTIVDGAGKLWSSDGVVNNLTGIGTWRSRKAPGITNSLEILSENTGVIRWAFSEALLTGYASDGTSTRMILDAGDSPTSRVFSNIFSGTGQHLTFQNNGTQVLGVERSGEIRFYDSLKQTTVGAAGAAAALPATPTAYFKVKTQTGTTLVIPAYLAT